MEDLESESISFHEDMIKVLDRLPRRDEYRRVRELILQRSQPALEISGEELDQILQSCPHIEKAVLSGVPRLTNTALATLAANAINLQELDISGCAEVTDAGMLEMTAQSLPLQSIRMNRAAALTDTSVSAIAKTCSRLIELELGDLPGLTPVALRDVWTFSRKLRTLRVANCSSLNDKAFPSVMPHDIFILSPLEDEKPLPHRPTTVIEVMPPLILRHRADNLRVLDLTACSITDDAISGIIFHASRIQTLILTGCNQLTDGALESIACLERHLDVLILAHVVHITDRGLIKLARVCTNLRCLDVAFCRNLTDMPIFELAKLESLRRLSLVRLPRLTDIAIHELAEHAASLERLHLSYCDQLSLDSIHALIKRLSHLHYLTADGVPSLKRKGIERFSELPPNSSEPERQAAYRVFAGQNIVLLRRFLDKEEKRRREAESRNIPLTERPDDKLELH